MNPLSSLDIAVLDANSEYLGVSRLQLMENAGAAVAKHVRSRVSSGEVVVVCGPGNNGGDGMVAARHLSSTHRVTVVLLAAPERVRSELARANLEALRSMQLTLKLVVDPCASKLSDLLEGSDVVVDAIFGTGLRREVRGAYRRAIEAINDARSPLKVSVDVPSGLDSDTGEVKGVAVKADVTVTFHAPKPGLLKEKAREYVGELVVEPIGIPAEAELICGPGDVLAATKPRRSWSKKGDFGRILVVGGSDVFTGAPALVALASLRMGADLAVVMAPKQVANVLRSFSPNLIVKPYDAPHLEPKVVEEVIESAQRFDVVAIGPGLGLADETLEAVCEVIGELVSAKPLVVDADALKALARDPSVVKGGRVVLTPHAGEYRIMTGRSVGEDLEDRMRAARELAAELECTVLLKGHVDAVSDGSRVKVNRTGNPGMTVGGTGDVLTGVAAALLAWTRDPFRAACAAAFVNGLAGDLAAVEKGYHLTATDVVEKLPEAHRLALDPAECRRVRPPLADWEP